MPATLETIDAILKDFYIGPLQEQLNNEVMCLQMFEKAEVTWAGRRCIVPLHIGRNDGVNFLGEGDNLPLSGEQVTVDMAITASYLYGTFELTGQAIASAKKGGSGSFVSSLEMEMDKLKDDIRNRADRTCVSGNDIVGYVLPNGYADAAAGVHTLPFRGDFNKLIELGGGVLPAPWTAVTFNLINNTNFVLSGAPAGAAPAPAAYEAINPAPCQILTAAGIDAGAGTITFTVPAGPAALFSQVNAGYGVAVEVVGGNAAAFAEMGLEPSGIYRNLSSPAHFGVPRGTAAGVYPAVPAIGTWGAANARLQSLILVNDATGAAATDLTIERMQDMLDEMNELSGIDPNVILVHPTMRSKYMSNLSGGFSATSNSQLTTDTTKAGHGDGGFLGLSYGGIPVKTSRHVGRGLMIFLSTKTWKMAVLKDGNFADMDGSVIQRVAGVDSWGGFYNWYYDHYCYRPNANGILTMLLAGSWT